MHKVKYESKKKAVNKLKSVKLLRKVSAIVLTMALLSGLIVASNEVKDTDEEVKAYKLSELQVMAIENNSSLKTLNSQLEGMQESYEDYEEGIESLKKMYDKLPRYKELWEKENLTNSDEKYQAYLGQAMIVNMTIGQLGQINESLEALYSIPEAARTPEQIAQIAGLESARASIRNEQRQLDAMKEEIDDEIRMQLLGASELMDLKMMEMEFNFIGITSPNLSKEDEYNKFIVPLYIQNKSIVNGIENLENAINIAKVNISSGVTELYKGVINTKSFYDIQLKAIEQQNRDIELLNKKKSKGLITQNEIDQAVNSLEVANLEAEKLKRQVDNLEMNLKLMIGMDLTKDLALVTQLVDEREVLSLAVYSNKAQLYRLDLKSKSIAKEIEHYKFDQVKAYYEEADYAYKEAKYNYDTADHAYTLAQKGIEEEIDYAYHDVLNKGDQVKIAKLEYEDVLRQYDELVTNYELGFVTENTLTSFEILKIQKKVTYINAIIDYNSGIVALENATERGPAYRY